MLELPINQYNITEVKYKLSETKTVTFKLNNFMLKDVDVEEIAKEITTEEPDYHPFSTAEDYKKPVGEMKVEELTKAVKNCEKNRQYAIDRTIIDEHEAVKEKKINGNFNKLEKVDRNRCKELMDKLDAVPYKVYEKIGELYTNNNADDAEGIFISEPDPYVVNDERELPKQKSPRTLKKMEASKKIIEKDAKEDSKIIKERVENSIGTNEPLSDELTNAPKKRSYNEKEWVNKDLEKCKNVVSDAFKTARDKALETKLILEVEDEREATE